MPGVVTTEEETLFLDNVLPSFINTWVNEDRVAFIYFANGLSENRIYRATISGQERNLMPISVNTALHLVVIGEYLYYSNYNHNHYLYRINLNTHREEIVLAAPVFGTTTDGERLFFLSGEPGKPFHIYTLHPEEPTDVKWLGGNAGMTLLYDEERELLFYQNVLGHVLGITVTGEQIILWDEINVHTFALDGDWLIFTEPGRMQPRVMHMRIHERITLDATYWLAYIWARNGVLYGLDHTNNAMTHMLQLP
jgi:hypothetical protein